MSQIRQPEVGPDGLRHINDYVAVLIPGREDSDLGFPLWADGPIEKSAARMAPTRVRQNQQRCILRASRFAGRADAKLIQGRKHVFGFQAGGGRYLVRGEAMIPDHILQPGTQLFVAGRLAEVPGLIVTRCLQGYG